jgi:putative hydrolase of the HAD superfamily
MPPTNLPNNQIEVILFDMNGTLRKRVPDLALQKQNQNRLSALLGLEELIPTYMEGLTRRYKTYTRWADEHRVSLSEAEIWGKWLTPELPPAQVESQAAELMLAFRKCRGKHILKPDVVPVLRELERRGYRLGVISNTTSTKDLPLFIDENKLAGYFETVILSSACGIRKPAPGIFREATQALGIDPIHCAYLGNKPSNDVAGPRLAGFGMTILVNNGDITPEFEPNEKPDLIIHKLGELLDIFPKLC